MCESAYKLCVTDCYVINRFFPDDPLWDGQQCDNDEATCCTGTNTPPWFSVGLPNSTSDEGTCCTGTNTPPWFSVALPNSTSDEGTCCTGTNIPPWFSVALPNSTSDVIEVRMHVS